MARTLWLIGALAAPIGVAAESDQFIGWDRPLPDAAPALQAWVNQQLDAALDTLPGQPRLGSCDLVEQRAHRQLAAVRFRPEGGFSIDASPMLSIYATAARTHQPTSPTIEVHGVRLGVEKVEQFFVEGWRAYRLYARELDHGATSIAARRRALRPRLPRADLVRSWPAQQEFSLATLEAIDQGAQFYATLCRGASPLVGVRDGRWRRLRSFEPRSFVTPEWDESWQPRIFGAAIWAQVRPAMATRCAALSAPEVRRRRLAQRRRDKVTLVEQLVAELIEAGAIPNPERFSIESVCTAPSSTDESIDPDAGH